MPSIARPCEWFCGRGPRPGTLSSETSSRRTRSAVRTSRRSGRPDRRSEDGSTHREWPVPRRAVRARPAARPPPQPPLLGASPGLRRQARHQIRAVGYRPQRGAEERRARRRHGRSTSGRPGRSSAAGGALGRARRHRLRAPRRPARTERSPGASQQARSPRARVRDRPPRARPTDMGEIDPSARVLDSAVHLAQSRYYEPNWSAYRYRPAQARRLLGQAGCRRGADGIFSCGGQRLSLRFVTTAGSSGPSAGASPYPGAASGCGVEVVPVFAPTGSFFSQILPQGALRRRTLLVGRFTRCIVFRCLRLRWAAEFHRLLPAARHRRSQPGRQDPRRASTRPCLQPSRPGARE